jgi:hypothetical protein
VTISSRRYGCSDNRRRQKSHRSQDVDDGRREDTAIKDVDRQNARLSENVEGTERATGT